MITESPEMLADWIAVLLDRRLAYSDDLDAVLSGWIDGDAAGIAHRIDVIDRDLEILRDRLRPVDFKGRRYKGAGVYIIN